MSNDFLDRVSPPAIASTIHCDNQDCSQRIVVDGVITERQSVVIALEHGWTASAGTQRAYHWCKECR